MPSVSIRRSKRGKASDPPVSEDSGVGGKGGKAKKQATGKARKPTLATKLAAAKPPLEKVPTHNNSTTPIEASNVAEGRTSPEVIVIDSTTC